MNVSLKYYLKCHCGTMAYSSILLIGVILSGHCHPIAGVLIYCGILYGLYVDCTHTGIIMTTQNIKK